MSRDLPSRAVRALAALPFLLLFACVHDFGDAPDGGPTGYPSGTLVGGAVVPATGNFPSLESSDGARVSSVSDATLGPGATLEGDALLTNADSDDGTVFLMVIVVSIPPPAQMIVQITGQTPGTYFLNALLDLNMNGEWGDIGPNGEQEWAVQNFPVTIGPGPTAVIPLPFAFGWGNRLPVTTWMRVALTSAAIPAGTWDGTGEFASGEIEDHFVTLPLSPGGGGGGGSACQGKPIPRMDCGGPYFFPDGVNQIPVRCVIRNLGGTGRIDWLLAPLNGCAVTLAPVLDLSGPRGIACPNGRIVLNFVATRGDPLPCSWSYDASSLDPPSYMTATGLVAGHTDSNGSFLIASEGATVEEVWIEDLQAEVSGGGVLRARALLSAAGGIPSAGAFVELGIMYPDGQLAEQRAEIVDGIATAEFDTRGAGVHMVRVVRVVGPTWHYRPDKDKTLMDAVTLP